jgi:hypothetical protein
VGQQATSIHPIENAIAKIFCIPYKLLVDIALEDEGMLQ